MLQKISDAVFGKSPNDGRQMNSYTFESGDHEVTVYSSWNPGDAPRDRSDDGPRSKPPLF